MFQFTVDDDVVLKLLDIPIADQLFELIDTNRAHLKKWMGWVDQTKSLADSKAFIEMTKRQFAANNGFQAGIWYQGELAGVIGYHEINWTNRSVSIGYWLGEEYQGNGVMTKACKAFVDHAINEFKLNRVEIRCAEKNFKSRAIPERLGFMQEGIIREAEKLGEHYVDLVVYGILAEEWE